jgi:hypothetical protein
MRLLLKKYGIKTSVIAQRMGIDQSLLRYHLRGDFRNGATAQGYKMGLIAADLLEKVAEEMLAETRQVVEKEKRYLWDCLKQLQQRAEEDSSEHKMERLLQALVDRESAKQQAAMIAATKPQKGKPGRKKKAITALDKIL